MSCASNVAYPAGAAVASVKVLDAVGILHCGVGETPRRGALLSSRRMAFVRLSKLYVGVLAEQSCRFRRRAGMRDDQGPCGL